MKSEMIKGSLVDNRSTRNLSCQCFDPMFESSSRRDEARIVGVSIGSLRDPGPLKLIDSSQCACLTVRPAHLCGCGRRCSGWPHPSISCMWQSSSRVPHTCCRGWSASLWVPYVCFSASFMTSSMVQLVRCRTLIPAQLTGWLLVQVCSAMVDLSMRHFARASLCSFSCVPSLCLVSPMYTLPQVHGTS